MAGPTEGPRAPSDTRVEEREVDGDQWVSSARELYGAGWWFEGLWAAGAPPPEVRALWARRGEFQLLRLPCPDGTFPSLTPLLPVSDWFERAVRDHQGLLPKGHVDPRPFRFHEPYPPDYRDGTPLPPGGEARSVEFPFVHHEGPGAFEIPVGPIHAGIIEPGHFRFTTAGEIILDLELRLNYSHKGTLALARGKPIEHAARLLERLSGDNAAAHACAFAVACETALGRPASFEVDRLRTALVELERLHNYLGDLAGIATDVAFAAGAAHFLALREEFLRWNQRLFGHRLLMNTVAFGGFHRVPTRDAWRHFVTDVPRLRARFDAAARMILNHSGLKERIEGTGQLNRSSAELLGCVGPVARASGVPRDARADAPCLAYPRLPVRVVTRDRGTVASRTSLRHEEAGLAFDWLQRDLADVGLEPSIGGAAAGDGEGLAFVESSRGAVLSWVRIQDGRVADVFQRDPSFLNWRAIEEAVLRNIVPDFPLINKSFNLSYSGSDA